MTLRPSRRTEPQLRGNREIQASPEHLSDLNREHTRNQIDYVMSIAGKSALNGSQPHQALYAKHATPAQIFELADAALAARRPTIAASIIENGVNEGTLNPEHKSLFLSRAKSASQTEMVGSDALVSGARIYASAVKARALKPKDATAAFLARANNRAVGFAMDAAEIFKIGVNAGSVKPEDTTETFVGLVKTSNHPVSVARVLRVGAQIGALTEKHADLFRAGAKAAASYGRYFAFDGTHIDNATAAFNLESGAIAGALKPKETAEIFRSYAKTVAKTSPHSAAWITENGVNAKAIKPQEATKDFLEYAKTAADKFDYYGAADCLESAGNVGALNEKHADLVLDYARSAASGGHLSDAARMVENGFKTGLFYQKHVPAILNLAQISLERSPTSIAAVNKLPATSVASILKTVADIHLRAGGKAGYAAAQGIVDRLRSDEVQGHAQAALLLDKILARKGVWRRRDKFA